ncbi:MAG: DNA phosphorothioation-associated protein 4 [Brasilonema octagenarum HA4186-MV1]|jgi:dnd system-associated protein 4|uniref:DNA phosphorothioation-associated protein 4 n=1 Tax=Brasilonema octagenarum UFV-OR1 TaxID=417115 RepID=A0ABX1M7W4_9CYAN|nr:DNA phosphorothioation-associated protein 4 [Brasilonema octagenarum]MBW4629248.1 DNA phosphorothioation-associated protein 4 [Brasilonema octagenarum HA4186-MV1]NMF64593.1 DNA phosphorothioation-associated protein 4 [Brasilonema octagenarum UFV-OR1]
MAETGRIRVAKDKAELVKALTSVDGATGPFQTYADVIVFAAALGAKHNKRVPLGEISKREPSPIPQEQFIVRGYDTVINVIAITETKDIKILSFNEDKNVEKRNHIFEEYANGGLELLQAELHGAVDYTERILLMLSSEKLENQPEEEFDLSRFI